MTDVEMGKWKNVNLADDADNNNLLLKVRTKEGSEMDLVLRRGGLVDDLKQEIIRRLELVDKNVRLIFSGKLLDPPTAPLNSFKLNNGSFIHAVITNKAPIVPNSEQPEESPVRVTVDLRNLRGLDMLLIPGPQRNALSVDEVASLRLYFNEDIQEYAEDNMQRGATESEEDFTYRAETEWAASQGPTSEFRFNIFGLSMQSPALANEANTSSGARALRQALESEINSTPNPDSGTNREFFFGFFMGFMLGFMMIFCVWDRNVSHKQKLGIMLGVLVQLLFTVMQQEQVNANKSQSGELHQSLDNNNLGTTLPGAPPVAVIDESSR